MLLITTNRVLRTSREAPISLWSDETPQHCPSPTQVPALYQHRHQFPEEAGLICQGGLSSLTQRVVLQPNMLTIQWVYISVFSYCLNRVLPFPGAGKQFKPNQRMIHLSKAQQGQRFIFNLRVTQNKAGVIAHWGPEMDPQNLMGKNPGVVCTSIAPVLERQGQEDP